MIKGSKHLEYYSGLIPEILPLFFAKYGARVAIRNCFIPESYAMDFGVFAMQVRKQPPQKHEGYNNYPEKRSVRQNAVLQGLSGEGCGLELLSVGKGYCII